MPLKPNLVLPRLKNVLPHWNVSYMTLVMKIKLLPSISDCISRSQIHLQFPIESGFIIPLDLTEDGWDEVNKTFIKDIISTVDLFIQFKFVHHLHYAPAKLSLLHKVWRIICKPPTYVLDLFPYNSIIVWFPKFVGTQFDFPYAEKCVFSLFLITLFHVCAVAPCSLCSFFMLGKSFYYTGRSPSHPLCNMFVV